MIRPLDRPTDGHQGRGAAWAPPISLQVLTFNFYRSCDVVFTARCVVHRMDKICKVNELYQWLRVFVRISDMIRLWCMYVAMCGNHYWEYEISSAETQRYIPWTTVHPSRGSDRRRWCWACTVGDCQVVARGRQSATRPGTSRQSHLVGSRPRDAPWIPDTGTPPIHPHTNYDHTLS